MLTPYSVLRYTVVAYIFTEYKEGSFKGAMGIPWQSRRSITISITMNFIYLLNNLITYIAMQPNFGKLPMWVLSMWQVCIISSIVARYV